MNIFCSFFFFFRTTKRMNKRTKKKAHILRQTNLSKCIYSMRVTRCQIFSLFFFALAVAFFFSMNVIAWIFQTDVIPFINACMTEKFLSISFPLIKMQNLNVNEKNSQRKPHVTWNVFAFSDLHRWFSFSNPNGYMVVMYSIYLRNG